MRASWVFAVTLSLFVISACGGGGDETDGPGAAACGDGVDNDGDGAIDFPADPGCADEADETEDSPPLPQCSDGRDNDGDGLTDYPYDPGCFAKQADDETDDCPNGAFCPQCANGKDDDQNGSMDFPNDPGCESAADASEFLNNETACGAGLKIKQLPATGMDMGMLEAGSTSTSNLMSTCGAGGGAPAVAYVMLLTEPKVVVVSTDDVGTDVDTVIDIRGMNCSDPTAELACNDNISTANTKSTVIESLAPGIYYIVIRGKNVASTGTFYLKVEKFAGEGTPCTMQPECGPGLFCRTPVGGSQMVCSKPVCDDGLDDDGDNKIDYPNDPGCGTPEDDSETDSCPGAGCPECGNGVDDDGDMTTDYPADLTCKAAADASEACATTEGVVLLTNPQTQGDTTTATSDGNLTCTSSSGSGPDRTYRLDVPQLTSLSLNMSAGFDTATALFNSTCGGTALSCSDPLNMSVTNLAAGTYYFVVDGYFTTSKGPYTINVNGKIANGQSCESALAQSGALTCGAGYACKGTVGARTCQIAQCGDGMDNNANGKSDYPADPGCDSSSDDSETTVCPGAMCPVCSNMVDDDMDGQTDYPADTACSAASGNNESCVSSEPIGVVSMAATMGTTVGATNDVKLACASSSVTALAPDIHHQLDLPAMKTVTLSLSGKSPSWDSAIALFNGSCGGTALGCADPDTLTVTNLAAGRYYFVVDGWSSSSGNYTLNVTGKIASGGRCDGALATAGALTCDAGFTCGGPTGNMTCTPVQCRDGIDNNGDGKTDYPNDPGCASAADDTEATVCPGAGCPACANGTDDDMDTTTDFPADFGCAAAGATTEVFCAGEPDVGPAITTAATMGDLSNAADNYDQTCQSSTGNDRAYALQLPVPVQTLVIDTIGSTVSDTVVSLKDASCGTQLGCDDDGDPAGLRSLLTVSDVPAGNYAIQVDGYGTGNNGAFTLNVKGTVAPMTSCASPLFAAGVLVCPTGTTCNATSMRCQ